MFGIIGQLGWFLLFLNSNFRIIWCCENGFG